MAAKFQLLKLYVSQLAILRCDDEFSTIKSWFTTQKKNCLSASLDGIVLKVDLNFHSRLLASNTILALFKVLLRIGMKENKVSFMTLYQERRS